MNKLVCVISIAALSGLTACSSVKEMFPDKEKDYQFSTAIAPLTIPDDLAKGMPSPSSKPASSTDTEQTEEKTIRRVQEIWKK